MKPFFRRFVHLLTVTLFAILGLFIDDYLPRYIYIIIGILLLIIFFGFELFRLINKNISQRLTSKFSYLYKSKEERNIVASIWGPIDLLILVLIFSKPVVVCTLWVGAVSDPMAAMAGIKFGGKKNATGKTWAGTIAHCLTSTMTVSIACMINILYHHIKLISGDLGKIRPVW